MKYLLNIPMLHSPKVNILGALPPALEQITDDYWDRVYEIFGMLEDVDIRLYLECFTGPSSLIPSLTALQEELSLPSDAPEATVLEDLIENNHVLLETTESSSLLLEQFTLLARSGNWSNLPMLDELTERSDEALPPVESLEAILKIMQERDAFTARMINDTLQDNELGILMFGAEHKITPRLNGNILVSHIDTELALFIDEARQEVVRLSELSFAGSLERRG